MLDFLGTGFRIWEANCFNISRIFYNTIFVRLQFIKLGAIVHCTIQLLSISSYFARTSSDNVNSDENVSLSDNYITDGFAVSEIITLNTPPIVSTSMLCLILFLIFAKYIVQNLWLRHVYLNICKRRNTK